MLKGLLEKSTCASCRICCGFDNTDLWELPVMNKETIDKLLAMKPDAKIIERNGGYVADAGVLKDGKLFYCPALDSHKGCTLGREKPFDCLIWPFRVMQTPDKCCRMITVSPVCLEIYGMPLSKLCEFVKKNLRQPVFEYADSHPEIIKEYIEDYPILALKVH